MKNDPLTIIIALNIENKSKGIIYFDDEESFDYKKGKYSVVEISYNYNNNKEIDFKWVNNNYDDKNNIEKVIIIGEDELSLFTGQAKAELIMENNKKYNLGINQIFEKRQIEIIRPNKYDLKEIKKIRLI